jgi:hypothetical protein
VLRDEVVEKVEDFALAFGERLHDGNSRSAGPARPSWTSAATGRGYANKKRKSSGPAIGPVLDSKPAAR